MSETEIIPTSARIGAANSSKIWLAGGGLLGAVLASACCIGPLVLLTLGVSGAWIGNLTALEPYKPAFAAIALICVGLGFRQVYFAASPACAEGSYCAKPGSALVAKTVLWAATVLVALALSINWWAPVFY